MKYRIVLSVEAIHEPDGHLTQVTEVINLEDYEQFQNRYGALDIIAAKLLVTLKKVTFIRRT